LAESDIEEIYKLMKFHIFVDKSWK